jgi:hypothetical protein
MVDLDFQVENVEIEVYSAAPLLLFCLRVTNCAPTVAVQNVLLNCQIRIEPVRRQYSDSEQERLSELFGESSRWAQTLRGLLWTNANVAIPAFDREAHIRLPVHCTHDLNIASAKYFNGLLDGEAPLTLLFSGSVFYRENEGQLQVAQIPWSKEIAYRLPLSIWRTLMETHYVDQNWLMLGRETFDRLHRFKRELRHLTFDDTLKYLLDIRAKDIAS